MDNVLGQSSSSWDQQSCLELSFSSHISPHPHSKVAEFLGTDPQFGRTSYSKRVKGQKEGLVTSSTTSQPPDGPTVKVREAIDHLPKNQRREATRAAEFTWALLKWKHNTPSKEAGIRLRAEQGCTVAPQQACHPHHSLSPQKPQALAINSFAVLQRQIRHLA